MQTCPIYFDTLVVLYIVFCLSCVDEIFVDVPNGYCVQMAEQKYDLALKNTQNLRIQNKPWYKERIKTRYIKSLSKTDTSQFLVGKDWVFLKDGLDDFRDGLPPPVDSGIFIKPDKGLSPVVHGSSDDISRVKQPVVRNRFTKQEICYSKATPLQQQRRDHIDEIEFGLSQHPLALYPHLEESMPPELFEDVIDILDPEMNLLDEDSEKSSHSPSTRSRNRSAKKEETPDETPENEEPTQNPYKWLPMLDEKDKKDKKKLELRSTSPSQDEHIKEVTKEFCDWVAGLGGDSNNIEESTVTSLFASGYETKPALSVPIHVVELTSVPPELRANVALPPQKLLPDRTDDKYLADGGSKTKSWMYSGQYEPSWARFRYGAWYLPKKHWRQMPADEALRDPKEMKDTKQTEAKKRSETLDGELAPMHGAKSFIEFVDKKGTRKPEFLHRVAELQRKAEAEERARLEAEAARKTSRRISHSVPAMKS